MADDDRDDDEGTTKRAPAGDGAREVLAVVLKVSRLVFLLLAVLCVLGIIVTLLPTNAKNGLVSNVQSLSSSVAGPFKDVFEIKKNKRPDRDRSLYANYALAALVYTAIAVSIGRLGSRFTAPRRG